MGHKYLPHSLKKSLYKIRPNKIRDYNSEFVNQTRPLIDLFTREDFSLYEDLLKRWGGPGRKRQDLTKKIKELGITSTPIIEMSNLRLNDLYTHQRVKQMLRHKWTAIYSYKKDQLNLDEDKIWLLMAGNIQKNCSTNKKVLYEVWKGPTGKQLLAEFLKNLYLKQDKKCAISGEPMTIEIGDGGKTSDTKASPDRKNSNKGYAPDNLWLTAWWVNSMKSNMSLITFYKRIECLARARGMII